MTCIHVLLIFINSKSEVETQIGSEPNMKFILLKNGLDPKRWFAQFCECGIIGPEHIKEIEGSHEVYEILCRVASENEKKALKKLLNIDLESSLKPTSLGSNAPEDMKNTQSQILVQTKIPTVTKHDIGNPVMKLQTHDSTDTTQVSKNLSEEFLSYLSTIGLHVKYPQKLTLQDALLIRYDTLTKSNKTTNIELLPILILQRIMNSDYRNRKCLLGNLNADVDDDTNKTSILFHPVDIFLAILHCSNEFLQQDLFAKFSNCKFALPFVLPNPVDNTLTLLLWAMRAIIYSWKVKCPHQVDKWLPRECSIVDYKMPIVAFMRLGNYTFRNCKSKILNAVIGESNHEYFFHWDCDGGNHKRKFVEGLIEFCCYLPSGKETDCHSDAMLFINLRGDLQCYPRQVELIKNISFMLFVLINANDLNHKTINLLQNLSSVPGGIVLLVSGQADRVSLENFSQIEVSALNLATTRDVVKRTLVKKLQNTTTNTFMTISDCAMEAKKLGINIDENNEECIKGLSLADDIMKNINDSDKIVSKVKIVPLQGSDLWQEWARCDKEYRRHLERQKENFTDYNDKIDQKKSNIRKQQLHKSQHLSPAMNRFVNNIKTTSGNTRIYFLKWLKMHLDSYSRKTLPDLHNDYINLKNKRKSLIAQNAHRSSIEAVDTKLGDIDKALTDASFGLEHFFREVSQLYEARMQKNIPGHLKNDVLDLPKIMTEIMVDGFALELMDGDASHVPIIWMKSVVKELKKICKGKNICVVSVIGIQSTGKSTLLNTMFGLHFNVSAGRCTRGAFFQLLALDDTLQKKINCSYILVVDTEGLRAPELQTALGLTKRDNELATFVIGLADITIVNIYGEAPADMDDILQTAIHAFIRMANVDLHPSCLFVHQNVTSTLAILKGEAGRKKFQDKLDEMTKCAAKHENCIDKYQVFSKIINFDDKHDVFPFPVLWEGSPPMAPVCTEYSESALNLTIALTKMIASKKSSCTITQFETRLEDLWEAVLLEKFVFSFKNTMEVAAYSDLHTEMSQWLWKIQEITYKLESEANTLINNCICIESINEKLPILLEDATKRLNIIYEQQLKELERFFETDKNKSNILSQWHGTTVKRLLDLKDECESKLKAYCESSKANRQRMFEVEDIQNNYQKEFQNHLREEVKKSKVKGIKFSTQEIDKMFSDIWDKWVLKVKSKNADLTKIFPSDKDIETSFTESLRAILRNDDSKVLLKLRQLPIEQRGYDLDLEIMKSHVNKTGVLKYFRSVNMEEAKKQNKSFLTQSSMMLKSDDNFKIFDSAIMFELLKDLFDKIETFNKNDKQGYIFNNEYIIDILLVVGTYAVRHYQGKMAIIRKKNDPLQTLQTNRVLYLNNFRSEYNEITQETAAAENFCHLVVDSIKKKQIEVIRLEIVDKMKSAEGGKFFNQRGFKVKVLEDLAKEENFEKYTLYLSNIRDCFMVWAKLYVERFCEKQEEGKSKFEKMIEEKLNSAIERIAQEAKSLKGCENVETWLIKFHEKLLSHLVLDLSLLQRTVGVCKINDLNYFIEQVVEGLENAKNMFMLKPEELYVLYHDVMNCDKPPHIILYNAIIGCSEQCPFCKEQCELDAGHITNVPHCINIHRPDCLGRYKWRKSKELSFDLCNESIGSNATFRNSDTNDQRVAFKEYKTIYKEWYIDPGKPKVQPLYWQWFVAKFNNELSHWCRAVPTQAPSGWKSITQEQAIAYLNEVYNLNI